MAIMVSRSHVVVIFCVTLVMLVAVRLYYDREDVVKMYKDQQTLLSRDVSQKEREHVTLPGLPVSNNEEVYKLMGKLIEQRNNLSRALNSKQQKVGQLECEVSNSLSLRSISWSEQLTYTIHSSK